MKLFDIMMNLKYGDGYFLLKKDRYYDELSDYVFHKTNTKPRNLIYIVDQDFRNLYEAIESDVLNVYLAIGLFSEKVVNLLKDCGDFEFVDVEIVDQYGKIQKGAYFLTRVKRQVTCIDWEKSETDGDSFFDRKIIMKKDKIPEDVFAFLDDDHQTHFTENFIKLIQKYELDIDFTEKDIKFS